MNRPPDDSGDAGNGGNGGRDPDAPAARRVARGVARLFADLGYGVLTEFPVNGERRVDVIAIDGTGEIAIVEIKTSATDFRADAKWRDYVPYCNAFYFAVPEDFPRDLLPADCGLIVADAFDAAVVRPAPAGTLNATRRRHLLLRFAVTASRRLARLVDPRP